MKTNELLDKASTLLHSVQYMVSGTDTARECAIIAARLRDELRRSAEDRIMDIVEAEEETTERRIQVMRVQRRFQNIEEHEKVVGIDVESVTNRSAT